MTKNPNISRDLIVPDEYAGQRLDRALSALIPEFSRGRLQTWIRSGAIRVDDRIWRARDKVAGGERVVLDAEPEPENPHVVPQNISLDVRYEDDSILIINKPAGLVVHPAAGHSDNTLQNALLYHWPELDAIPRAGIVHRLDKLTSGVMVVARTLEAHQHLVNQLQERSVKREYVAVVNGVMVAGGTVDAPVGRHPVDRKRMAVTEKGKPAITHYRVEQKFRAHTLVQLNLETGRTHQIRVHMASINYPLLGDPEYGGRLRLPRGATEELITVLRGFRRQALHARILELQHPQTGETVRCEVEMPDDMQRLIQALLDDMKAAET